MMPQLRQDIHNAAQLDPELYDYLSGPAQQEYADNPEIASRIRQVVKQVWPYFSSIGGDTISLVIPPTTDPIAPLNDATRTIDITLNHGDNAVVFFIPNAGQNWENAQSASYEIGAGGDKPWTVPNLIKIEPLHAGPESITVTVSESGAWPANGGFPDPILDANGNPVRHAMTFIFNIVDV
jgi:hypothetical protein